MSIMMSVQGAATIGRDGTLRLDLHDVAQAIASSAAPDPPRGTDIMKKIKRGELATHPSKRAVNATQLNTQRANIQASLHLGKGLAPRGEWSAAADDMMASWLLKPLAKQRRVTPAAPVADRERSKSSSSSSSSSCSDSESSSHSTDTGVEAGNETVFDTMSAKELVEHAVTAVADNANGDYVTGLLQRIYRQL
jgi:hypothetical protein